MKTVTLAYAVGDGVYKRMVCVAALSNESGDFGTVMDFAAQAVDLAETLSVTLGKEVRAYARQDFEGPAYFDEDEWRLV